MNKNPGAVILGAGTRIHETVFMDHRDKPDDDERELLDKFLAYYLLMRFIKNWGSLIKPVLRLNCVNKLL